MILYVLVGRIQKITHSWSPQSSTRASAPFRSLRSLHSTPALVEDWGDHLWVIFWSFLLVHTGLAQSRPDPTRIIEVGSHVGSHFSRSSGSYANCDLGLENASLMRKDWMRVITAHWSDLLHIFLDNLPCLHWERTVSYTHLTLPTIA